MQKLCFELLKTENILTEPPKEMPDPQSRVTSLNEARMITRAKPQGVIVQVKDAWREECERLEDVFFGTY